MIPQPYSINVTFIGDPGGDPADSTDTNAFILTGGYASVANNGDVSNNGGAIDAEDPNDAISLHNMEMIGNAPMAAAAACIPQVLWAFTACRLNTARLFTSYIEGNIADYSGTAAGAGNGGGLDAGGCSRSTRAYVLDNSADNGGGAYAAGNPQVEVY